ncbi:pyridoxal-phosphate dependent enzyme [Pantoea agglomerans]|uniref:pyridoxal-phosphate dependent enzyme n=1 Tax=Enterobacter agglomerans TaxID=549 RepID=UPI003209322D
MTNHTQRPMDSVTLKAIYVASARIKTTICRTPLQPSQALSSLAGAEVRLKMENFQHTGSFKLRGGCKRRCQS